MIVWIVIYIGADVCITLTLIFDIFQNVCVIED